MDVQHALLSKVILDQDIQTAVNAKVTPEWFSDERYQRIYAYCLKHWRMHGVAPDEAVVAKAYPSYPMEPYSQPIGYYIGELRKRRQRSVMLDGLNRSAALTTSEDPDSVDQMREVLRETLLSVTQETGTTADEDFSQAHGWLVQYLDERLLNSGYLRGISSGFHGIDYVTGGWQPEQFIVMMGLPKSLKSSMLLAMAKSCHQQAKRPLLLGFEMNNQEQKERLVSLYASVGLTKLQHGALTAPERQRALAAVKLLGDGIPFHLSTDMENGTTVSGVQAKILEYKPDVVFIDAAYLMMSELPKVVPGDAQALTDVARSLKKLAQAMKIPIVVTVQATISRARGGKLNMFSAMYTQAWGQSADVLLGVERVVEEDVAEDDTGEVMTLLKVLSSRSGPRAETRVVWDWSRGIFWEQNPAAFTRDAAVVAENADD